MVEQVNIQNLSEIKSLIEENNAVLRAAIQALEIFSSQTREILTNQTLQQLPQPILPSRNYPGYTTPVKYGFMQ